MWRLKEVRRLEEASLLVGECHKLLQNVANAGAAFETALAVAVEPTVVASKRLSYIVETWLGGQ